MSVDINISRLNQILIFYFLHKLLMHNKNYNKAIKT